ncbi:MYPU_1760 family metalloprotease [Mycoplasma struthionis]|uniref:Uncharacterized protein n=1 Tax=Mycoplasma struthionis TaxID=538220 RepID=A0A3G8LI55_9MOLU|nr:hypothetical protein [Mycoplasma struthionis]AZG68550.1 hypothetical protein EGN60_01000 [Mycoplasma struthionis]TPI02380.1 hypothetical protein FJM01_00840 [Mycoplasma struthionis]
MQNLKPIKTPRTRLPIWATILIVFVSLIALLSVGFISWYLVHNSLLLGSFFKPKVVFINNDDKQAETFNPKLLSETNSIQENPDFKYGNLTITEYPYTTNSNGQPVYFLGKEGRAMLNNEFLKRANYGPEINALNHVYINKVFDATKNLEINGVYFPQKFDLNLNIQAMLKEATSDPQSWPLARRVEMILPTLVHEYTHHIDNVYDRSIKNDDPLADNSLIYKLAPDPQSPARLNNANNAKFLKAFREALDYDAPKDYNNLTHPEFFEGLKRKPVFKYYTAYDLFKLANLPLTEEDEKRYDLLDKEDFYFNNNATSPVSLSEPVKLAQLRYLYSFEELVPRELLKMSFTTKNPFPPGPNYFAERLYFNTGNGNLFLTAFGDDVLRMLSFNEPRFGESRFRIFSTNWVFPQELNEYITADEEQPYANIGYQRLAKLFQAYIDLMGYGQVISYLGANNWKWAYGPNESILTDYQNLNFGGYLKIKKTDLDKENRLNHRFSFLIANPNNSNQYQQLNLHQSNYNFIAKKFWNATDSPRNVFTERSIYPRNPESEYDYIAYFSDSIDVANINSFAKNNRLHLKLWIDRNNNNRIEQSEVEDVLNNKVAKQYSEIEKKNARPITSYRKTFSIYPSDVKGLDYSYRIQIAEDKSQPADNPNRYYFSWTRY